MDERFRSRRTWVAAAVVGGIIFLCVTLCFLGALGTMFLRNSAAVVPQVQPPVGGEGAAVPQVYYGHWGGHSGMGVLGLLGFGAVLIFGLFLLLGIARFVLRPWHCSPSAVGGKWKDHPHPWGPWGWHTRGKRSHRDDGPAGSEEPATDEGAE